MGAAEDTLLPAEDRKKLGESGFDVHLDELPPHPEGVLVWRGEVVAEYIRDQTSGGADSKNRFHVAECSTLKSMRKQGRGYRYAISSRQDGLFPVKYGQSGPLYPRKMPVCRNCLSRVDWDGYRQATADERETIVTLFNISDFFQTYRGAGLLRDTPRHARPSDAGPAVLSRPVIPPSVTPAVRNEAERAPPSRRSAPSMEANSWVWSIPIEEFRAVASHIERHGSLTEPDFLRLLNNNPRLARRFSLSLEEWFKDAPFSVQIHSSDGIKTYHRVPR
jgi:hypothetical protein